MKDIRHLIFTFQTLHGWQQCVELNENHSWVSQWTFTCLCLRMPMTAITRSKMKTTTPLLMATQSQMSTGAFSVKQLIGSRHVTHFIAHASLSASFFHFSYQSLMIAQHMSTSSHFSRVHTSTGRCVPLSLQGWTEKVKSEERSRSDISISPQVQGQVDVLKCMSDSPFGQHKVENLQTRKLREGEIPEINFINNAQWNFIHSKSFQCPVSLLLVISIPWSYKLLII